MIWLNALKEFCWGIAFILLIGSGMLLLVWVGSLLNNIGAWPYIGWTFAAIIAFQIIRSLGREIKP